MTLLNNYLPNNSNLIITVHINGFATCVLSLQVDTLTENLQNPFLPKCHFALHQFLRDVAAEMIDVILFCEFLILCSFL